MNELNKIKNREKSKRYRDKNIEKCRQQTRKHYAENREYYLQKNRERYLKNRLTEIEAAKKRHFDNIEKVKCNRLMRLYGITLKEYYQLLQKQNFVCAICKCPETMMDNKQGITRRLAVDHCHSTNIVRGLLCYACNIGIGKFKHSIESLQNAYNYLKNQT